MTAALDTITFPRENDDDSEEDGRYDHPCELIPIEEGQSRERRVGAIVERRQQRSDKRKDQQ